MPKLDGLIFGGAICLLIGVVFTLVGLAVGRETGRLENLPVLTAADLRISDDGRPAGIDAHIAERNDLYFGGLVAYVRREYQGKKCSAPNDNCESIWVEDERVTPPLWLDAPDGRIFVINDDYTLQNEPVRRQTDSRLVKNETKAYRGFIIGNPVFVVGHVVAGHDPPAFHADVIYSGDSASFLNDNRLLGNVFFWLGLALSLAGLTLIAVRFLIT